MMTVKEEKEDKNEKRGDADAGEERGEMKRGERRCRKERKGGKKVQTKHK